MSSKGLVPPGLTYLADNIISKQNILGAGKEQRARWARGLNLPVSADTIFFAGCGYQYSDDLEALMSMIRRLDRSVIGVEFPLRFANLQKKLGVDLAGIYRKVLARRGSSQAQPLLDAVKVLQGFNIEFGYLGEEEPCCGAPLYFSGMHEQFADNARQAYRQLRERGIKRIISIVPSCTYALRSLFPLFVEGYDMEVKHFTEILSENISRRKLRFPQQVKITYHDPCQLARYLGLTKEPRQILKAIENVELVETDWTKGEWATCCGGGGGFEAVFPDLSEMLSANRARELAETGADTVVTQCPGCIMQLKDGLKAAKIKNVAVMDLAQVVAMAMEV